MTSTQVNPLTPPFTPSAPFTKPNTHSIDQISTSSRSTADQRGQQQQQWKSRIPSGLSSPPISPDFALPPPLSADVMPSLDLPGPYIPLDLRDLDIDSKVTASVECEQHIITEDHTQEKYLWRDNMTSEERDAREAWICEKRGRKGLRIVIVTENFLPKVDGVTRTLARLLEHLEKEGHSAMLLGPGGTGMSHYASHPLVGTLGVPLIVYPGLKLNFLRPKFMRTIRDFQPDVIHFVDPIWLGAQTLMAMELGWAGENYVSSDGPALGSGIRGAVVASYHTNLATYATLFEMSWLEPIMWNFQRWLYSKTLLTLCPSPSTRNMLESQNFQGVRLWPRGVDLSQFGPSKRSSAMRANWGVGNSPTSPHPSSSHQILERGDKVGVMMKDMGVNHQGRKVSLPLTPPATPWVQAVDNTTSTSTSSANSNEFHEEPDSLDLDGNLPERVVLLYVGRISWEKNLHLLLEAYKLLLKQLPLDTALPKLVFVGDGPARLELEALCAQEGFDAVFLGHQSGSRLAECYASADVFVFPSFTETFGQVVLEALASGLPVIGLDAEGTRDLVAHESTGLLLPLPATHRQPQNGNNCWPLVCRNRDTPVWEELSHRYARLLARAVSDHDLRRLMGRKACTDGIKDYTWWDAMEKCVDGYRESIRIKRGREAVSELRQADCPESPGKMAASTQSLKVSRINRVVSKRLAHKGSWGDGIDTAENIWHLKNVLKGIIVGVLFYAIYNHHLAGRISGERFVSL